MRLAPRAMSNIYAIVIPSTRQKTRRLYLFSYILTCWSLYTIHMTSGVNRTLAHCKAVAIFKTGTLQMSNFIIYCRLSLPFKDLCLYIFAHILYTLKNIWDKKILTQVVFTSRKSTVFKQIISHYCWTLTVYCDYLWCGAV